MKRILDNIDETSGHRDSPGLLSLTPSFGRPMKLVLINNPSQRFLRARGKLLKQFTSHLAACTRLKPGVNENRAASTLCVFEHLRLGVKEL
jgi:hypothetical protein